MDRHPEVTINAKALLRIVAGLFASAGIVAGGAVARLPRWVHLVILDSLRPAESSVRRLIAVLAAELVVMPRAGRSGPVEAIPRGTGENAPVFRLFDPRRQGGPVEDRVPGYGPSIRSLEGRRISIPVRVAPLPDDLLDAGRLCRRLNAVFGALNDLPAQAQRLARMLAAGKCRYLRVMRPGRPPGYRARRKGSEERREIDDILANCHEFALIALHEARGPP